MATVTAIDPELVEALRATVSGQVILPGEEGYDEARRVHNGLIDRHPAVIVCCQGTADVVDAIGFARDAGLEMCVRSEERRVGKECRL